MKVANLPPRFIPLRGPNRRGAGRHRRRQRCDGRRGPGRAEAGQRGTGSETSNYGPVRLISYIYIFILCTSSGKVFAFENYDL